MGDASFDDGGSANKVPFDLKPLMFQVFACTMAMTAFTALAGPIGKELRLAPWQMGLAVTVAGIAWMLLSRPWGIASDRHGRRPVLLWGLAGFAASYALLCLFVALALRGWVPALAAFAGIVLLRGISGGFYAAVPTAGNALIADHVSAERRAGAMAGLGMASGASMVVGPAVAALLAPRSLDLPLQVLALLPVLALAVLWKALPRVEASHAPHEMSPPRLNDPRLRRPVLFSLVCMFGVSVAQIVVGFYAIDRLGLSSQEGARVAGIALTCVGVAFTLAQMAVRLSRWTPETLIRLGTVVAGLGFLAVSTVGSAPALWLCYFVAASGMGLVWPSISALAANAVAPHEQGAAAGTVAAAQGFGLILGPVVGTVLYSAEVSAPYLMVGLMLLALVPLGQGRLAEEKA